VALVSQTVRTPIAPIYCGRLVVDHDMRRIITPP